MIQITNNNQIENKIKEIISLKNSIKTHWVAGTDWVQYAGPYFGDEEFIAAIDTLLNGWLALGEMGVRFERQFHSKLGKGYGALTNSGSSANLLMISALKSKKLNVDLCKFFSKSNCLY
jgi:CDP-6-deoxy-D-xylo-4-hexulose-3-dehydrase